MPSRKVPLHEAVEEYLQWLRDNGYAARTIRQRGYVLRDYEKLQRRIDFGEDRQLVYLRPEHVGEVFQMWRRPNPTRPEITSATLNRKRDELSQFFRWCERKRYLVRAMDLTAEIRRREVVRRRRQYLDVNQLFELLDVATHPRDRMLAAMGMHTGLRQSEIVALRISSVDLAGGWLDVQMFKNHKEDRLPITADLDGELRQWFTFYQENAGPLQDDWYLVPGKHHPAVLEVRDNLTPELLANTPLRPTVQFTNASHVMRLMLERMGMYAPYEGMHTLRRSAARAFYEAFLEDSDSRDEAMAVTQALLNHSDPKMTARYIGVERFRDKRDKVMRGKPILSSRVSRENVVPIREVVE